MSKIWTLREALWIFEWVSKLSQLTEKYVTHMHVQTPTLEQDALTLRLSMKQILPSKTEKQRG